MRFSRSIVKKNLSLAVILVIIATTPDIYANSPRIAYDLDMAREICSQLPLENPEGIWIYPEDKVTVMILRNDEFDDRNNLPVYDITVVETSDARIYPGDLIGRLYATAKENAFKIELSTEKKNDLMLKPKSCMATLSKDADAFIIKKQNAPFKGRLNLNLSRLLPGFWKMVSMGLSPAIDNNSIEIPAGMLKIYPSYDGNGSSKRKIRYL